MFVLDSVCDFLRFVDVVLSDLGLGFRFGLYQFDYRIVGLGWVGFSLDN